MQYPAKADYRPHQNVYLSDFNSSLRKVGLTYGGYSKLPYCFSTQEKIDGVVPIVVVCPMATGRRNSNYAVNRNDTVSAVWISMLIDTSASRELTRRAVSKAGLVARVFADVRYNVTQSSVGDVLGDETGRVMNREGASYVSSGGDSCNKRVRNLNNIGRFETSACFKRQGQAQVTIWF
ncbi:MAG: hypothetical protein AAGK97_11960 [Bacteroidota bacterium]